MFGTFPKAFPQAGTSQGYFPKSDFTTVQFPKRQLPRYVLAAALAHPPHCCLRRLRWPNITLGKLPLGKLHIWEVTFGKIQTPPFLEVHNFILSNKFFSTLKPLPSPPPQLWPLRLYTPSEPMFRILTFTH